MDYADLIQNLLLAADCIKKRDGPKKRKGRSDSTNEAFKEVKKNL